MLAQSHIYISWSANTERMRKSVFLLVIQALPSTIFGIWTFLDSSTQKIHYLYNFLCNINSTATAQTDTSTLFFIIVILFYHRSVFIYTYIFLLFPILSSLFTCIVNSTFLVKVKRGVFIEPKIKKILESK